MIKIQVKPVRASKKVKLYLLQMGKVGRIFNVLKNQQIKTKNPYIPLLLMKCLVFNFTKERSQEEGLVRWKNLPPTPKLCPSNDSI